MKEPSFAIEDAFVNGLRPDPRTSRNSAFLSTCKNLKPSEFRAVAPELVASPDTFTLDWPYPQMFVGRNVILLAARDKVYSVNPSTYALTELATYDWVNWISAKAANGLPPTVTKAITEGGTWHFVDMWDNWMLFNGACVVFKSGWSSSIFVQDSVDINAACSFRDGRVIYGGFNSANSFSAYRGVLESLEGEMPTDIATAYDWATGPGENAVWFSTIGGGDAFGYWTQRILTYGSATAINTGFSPSKPYLFDLIRKNQMGWGRMPWRGSVSRVMPLGDDVVIVLGTDGVSMMTPFTEPAPAFGVRPISNLGGLCGLAARGAVCGKTNADGSANDAIMFIDQYGELWGVAGGKGERLGFSEYLSGILDDDIQISYDSLEGDFWISNATQSFILNRFGKLGGPFDVRPTSVSRLNGSTLVGPALGTNQEFYEIEVVSDEFDLNERGSKHIAALQCGVKNILQGRTSVDYRYNANKAFKTTRETPLNFESVSFPRISFVDGRVRLKGKYKNGAQPKVERIEVRWLGEDLRYRRGTKGIPETA